MSALLPEADLCGAPTHFRFGPICDVSASANSTAIHGTSHANGGAVHAINR